jgi:solute carrier family 35 protein F5
LLLPDVKIELIKILMVTLSFSGIVVITLADSGSNERESSLRGNVLSLLSAMFYGLYAVILKRRISPEIQDKFNFSYFLGFVGLFNLIALLPLFFIFNYTGIETFEWPNNQALLSLSINAILGTVISDYCWAKSVVLMGPLVTTMGISLTIPISIVVDKIYGEKQFNWMFFMGSAMILTSFLVISSIDLKR